MGGGGLTSGFAARRQTGRQQTRHLALTLPGVADAPEPEHARPREVDVVLPDDLPEQGVVALLSRLLLRCLGGVRRLGLLAARVVRDGGVRRSQQKDLTSPPEVQAPH